MITSKDNEKLKLVRRLAERKHRDREGLFVSEGEDLLAAGLAAGRQPELVLSAPGTAERLSDLPGWNLGKDSIAEVERSLLDSVSTLGSGSRVVALWRQPWAEHASALCVYLNGVRDPGNVGAIARSAHALGAASVALDPDSADPFSPKAVRASMGSIFALDLIRAELRYTPVPRAGMVAHGGSWPPQQPPATLCLGSERDGLAGETAAACAELWTIPLPGSAESLGVAAAAVVALERISSAAAEVKARGAV